MKKLALVIVFLTGVMATWAQAPLQVMTFNLRYDNPGDSLNAWPYRKDNAASQVLFYDVHLLGVQEALHHQMEELKNALPRHTYFGVGRDDGKAKGEYSAIFYDTTRLQRLTGATFWLSEHSDSVGSKGWDAAITRIVTWCYFKDKNTGKNFYAFNTHFDHMGKIARAESARLLLRKVRDIAGKTPVVITGDFNATPDDEPIKILVAKENNDRFIDTKAVTQAPHYGPQGTFNAFTNKETSDQPIDHIFIKNGFAVLKHATLSETWNGHFSSDHFPVVAVLQF
jgi:endonuclease/exonuclease/phosphatase family metal-dependent hydrolase